MLRSALLVIGHVLTVDVIRLVQKKGGWNTETPALIAGAPSPFPHFRNFLPPPFPLPFLRLPPRLKYREIFELDLGDICTPPSEAE